MNIDYLRLFVRVAHLSNITKAGAEFGLSSTVASTHLSKLEASLNVRLLHRTTRKVTLTDEGTILFHQAEDIISAIDHAKSTVGGGVPKPIGTLRVTAPSSFGRKHLMPYLNEFMAKYPDLVVEFHLSDSIVDVIEGGFDIAIRDAPLKSSSLVAKKLAVDKRIICASPQYLKTHGTPLTPEALKAHQCINLFGNEHWVFQGKQENIHVKTSGSFKTNDGEAVLKACINGLGVAMTATWIAHEELSKSSIVQILEDYPLVHDAAIWAVYPSTKLLAPKVRAFIDHFAGCYGDPPYWDKLLQGTLREL
ncbi:LysR family transcriptional regulator [Alteromonas sp. KC3]|uniref:LysR family transcriptional regulator n=1 Tax=unclassified Alteromonas TaxID=2614992 RepID=UPI0019239349|nr:MULTISPECIES: LysR family transcriptional regulator [unclassified Alteromonas]BCO18452.1 LysR family transcriptional regulator [Alteromonas sp. KC3]BCO22413.1 LysR family transcriptional regulator [Alteromonas sp. KC14]